MSASQVEAGKCYMLRTRSGHIQSTQKLVGKGPTDTVYDNLTVKQATAEWRHTKTRRQQQVSCKTNESKFDGGWSHSHSLKVISAQLRREKARSLGTATYSRSEQTEMPCCLSKHNRRTQHHAYHSCQCSTSSPGGNQGLLSKMKAQLSHSQSPVNTEEQEQAEEM